MTDCPTEILSALSRLNEHARAGGFGRRAIYAYKTFVAADYATAARAIQIGVKCHHCDGTSIYRDFDGYERGQCWRCIKGIATLKFVESTIGDFRWHHPWHNGGQSVLDAVWDVTGWTYPEGAQIATLRDGTERKLRFEAPGSWGPNMPGAERLPTDEALAMLNAVEAWLERATPERGRHSRWKLEQATGELLKYRVPLARIDTDCWNCGRTPAPHNLCHSSATGWLELHRPTDFPGKFIARPWSVRKNAPFNHHLVGDTLDALVTQIPPGLIRIGRAGDDDPNIVEIWI